MACLSYQARLKPDNQPFRPVRPSLLLSRSPRSRYRRHSPVSSSIFSSSTLEFGRSHFIFAENRLRLILPAQTAYSGSSRLLYSLVGARQQKIADGRTQKLVDGGARADSGTFSLIDSFMVQTSDLPTPCKDPGDLALFVCKFVSQSSQPLTYIQKLQSELTLAEQLMSTPLGSETMSSNSVPPNTNAIEVNQQAPTDSSQQTNDENNGGDCIIQKKRRKTSGIWEEMDQVETDNGLKGRCKYCKQLFAYSGKGASTSHLWRHVGSCLQRKLHTSSQQKQPTIPFQPSNQSVNPFIAPGARYSNEKMREIMATAIMVHEHPFNIVEDEVWMWGFQYANSEFQKISRKTARSDCLAIYEAEKKQLKALLQGVSKISLTTDMWKSAHQVAEYMVITGHFIDAGWNLQKRVLSFVKVPAPRRGIDVADAIFKCLKAWGIENKVFSISVDNASYNDSCLRALKDTLSLSSSLPLGGSLFHVRCCAHILNLLVQDGLGRIRDIIHNVRESVKYINYNDSRLKAFCDVVEQKRLKEKKLIIDCPTRWNSTYKMLSTALKFKVVFPAYKEREPHYNYAPSEEDWNKVEKICKLLEVFNLATHVISGSEYPTANLYLPEVWRVKQVIDNAIEDDDFFITDMASSMKEKFDKYWGECNMLMAIASVLDPRCKLLEIVP
ncbi:zinc finger BED domain-containing protein RICESLEEPER 2-like [Neltuma alba]|uniref:zinc finger BED domain-containing protein RICESLEEPER 2-like n=1 Tax=Neltuma alba TaxID=207710 RepID=UPI0010A2BCF9|nr:zinc finger BED domain-containing protein RICESLEEPER 2-like [Prosopis alba]